MSKADVSVLRDPVTAKPGDERAALLAGAEALEREARDLLFAPIIGNPLAARTTREYAAMLRKLATNHQEIEDWRGFRGFIAYRLVSNNAEYGSQSEKSKRLAEQLKRIDAHLATVK